MRIFGAHRWAPYDTHALLLQPICTVCIPRMCSTIVGLLSILFRMMKHATVSTNMNLHSMFNSNVLRATICLVSLSSPSQCIIFSLLHHQNKTQNNLKQQNINSWHLYYYTGSERHNKTENNTRVDLTLPLLE